MKKDSHKTYSLNRRILMFYLIPLLFLISVVFLYINIYNKNVRMLAETTFSSIADVRQKELEENLDDIKTLTKELSYSPLLQQYLIEQNANEKVQTYAHFQNYLRAVSTNKDSVVSAYASLGNHSSVHMADGYLYMFEEAKNKLKLAEILNKNEGYFTDLRMMDHETPNKLYGMYFYLGSPIHGGSMFSGINMLGGVIYDPSKLLNITEDSQSHIAFLLMNGKTVFLTGDMDREAVERVRTLEDDVIEMNGETYFVRRSTVMQEPQMEFAYLVAQSSLIQHHGVFEKLAVAFILLSAVLLSLSVIAILNAIFLPIRQLSREVEQLKGYGEMLSSPRAVELKALTDTFNGMTMRLNSNIIQEKKMIDQHYQLQIQKNRMEIQAFRNQINPHFLFNTLECLSGMVRYYHIESVSNLITNLSTCFRYSLNSPMMVKLKDEVEHLNNYMDIINTRFPGKYRFVKMVDDETEDIEVPSLLLQPLAENAVTHAFIGNRKKAPPTIMLQVKKNEEDGSVSIHVTDNGMGMNEEKLGEVLSNMRSSDYPEKHISLNNVYRRLVLIYGKEQLSIRSKDGHYTRISVCIPRTVSENS
ncbi:MAG: histidine kinase [Clostridia bacterium]|nr:histidine kinase [Clostridia bacterium]MBQ4157174.1 histidine kinase [Clostridia bacterium]